MFAKEKLDFPLGIWKVIKKKRNTFSLSCILSMVYLKHIQFQSLLFLKISVFVVTCNKTFKSRSDLTWNIVLSPKGLNLILYFKLSCNSSMSTVSLERIDIERFINK